MNKPNVNLIVRQARQKRTFADLPRDYAGLCAILVPRHIRDAADYDNVVEITDAMAGFDGQFSQDQEDYFETLITLIEAYDAEHVKWPKRTPLQRLKFLLEQGDLSGADLSRILGGSRNLGAMILRGDREITAEHARTLGAYFHMEPGAFIA